MDVFRNIKGEIKTASIAINWVPCQMIGKNIGLDDLTVDTVSDDCISDEEEQKKYLDSLKL